MTARTGVPSGGVQTGGHANFVPGASGGLKASGAASYDVYLKRRLPTENLQKLDAGTIVTMYIIDTTILGGACLYLTPSVNEFGTGIIWKDMSDTTVTYLPFPIVADGFDKTGKGPQPRPTLSVSNVSHEVSALVRQYGDLCGCKVVRRRVMAQHLDAANFVAGNPNADRSIHYPDDEYYIERRAGETPAVISFELSSASDVAGVMVPRRVVQRNLCTWEYKGTDEQTSCPFKGPFIGLNATCKKDTTDCATKFPGQPLPFGGFKGARRM